MDYDEMLAMIQRSAGGIPRDAAELAAAAVLRTLADRLPRSEARHILQELPAELKLLAYTEDDAEPLDLDEFLARVAERENTDVETAFGHARAVFAALGASLGEETVRHLAATLPRTFAPLIAEARSTFFNIMPASQFWDRVGRRLGVDEATAQQVTNAVLETLAERIAAGEVEDLLARLDPLLHPPLRRGSESIPQARRMPLDEFLRRVAAREGADADEIELRERIAEHVRAVFATLAEAVGAEEWLDVRVELPAEYDSVIPRVTTSRS